MGKGVVEDAEVVELLNMGEKAKEGEKQRCGPWRDEAQTGHSSGRGRHGGHQTRARVWGA